MIIVFITTSDSAHTDLAQPRMRRCGQVQVHVIRVREVTVDGEGQRFRFTRGLGT
jgi:hypothetical protein